MAFPGFIAFVVYDPFVDDNNRLTCFELSNAPPSSNKGRANKRNQDEFEKGIAYSNDNVNKRDLILDQRVSAKSLQLQKLLHDQTKNESNMIELMGYSATLGMQINTAERRTMVRCPDYDGDNIH